MDDFRILTPVFTSIVPDTEYGRSIKDFLEIKVSPGIYPAMVEGYFVLLRFKAKAETYMVHSFASGPRELTGVYFSDLYYEIQVSERLTPRKPGRKELLHEMNYSQFDALQDKGIGRVDREARKISDRPKTS